MRGKLRDLTMNPDRTFNVTVTVDTDFRESFDRLKDKDLDIEIKQHRERRSKNANAYFHILVNKISQEIGESEEATKVRLVTSYGPLARTEDGKYLMFILPLSADATDFYKYAVLYDQREVNGVRCNCWKVYKDTHMMDTKEMSQLIEGAIAEARELGIETATPKELAEMKRKWEEYEAAHPAKGGQLSGNGIPEERLSTPQVSGQQCEGTEPEAAGADTS